MLVEYSFGNFKSFKEENSLSMLGVKSFKEHDESHVFTKDKLKVLKSSVIYGNNASGKSNLVIGITLMKNFVLNSFKYALNEFGPQGFERFLLNTQNEEIPTFFEVVFFQNDVRYRYGFEIYEGVIISEWLYHTHTVKEVPLFERDLDGIKINKTSFSEGKELDNKTRENVLFISVAAQFNGKVSSEVIKWFQNINIISGINDKRYSSVTFSRLQNDENFSKWVSALLQGLEIANITMELVDMKERLSRWGNKVRVNMVSEGKEPEEISEDKYDVKGVVVKTWHKRYDENNLLIDAVPFNIDQESQGTKKFINLLGPWYDTIKNGKLLIVDELDSRMHTRITKKLIELFNHKKNKKAQLLLTSHDVSLLDKDIFRRDQIWFTEKDQFGASSLYSLADFKAEQVRNTSSFSKNYLKGKFGAVSHIQINEEMEDLIYG